MMLRNVAPRLQLLLEEEQWALKMPVQRVLHLLLHHPETLRSLGCGVLNAGKKWLVVAIKNAGSTLLPPSGNLRFKGRFMLLKIAIQLAQSCKQKA